MSSTWLLISSWLLLFRATSTQSSEAILRSAACEESATSLLQVQTDRRAPRSPTTASQDRFYPQGLAWQQEQAPFPYDSASRAAQTSLAQAQAQALFPYDSASRAAQTSLAQAQAQAPFPYDSASRAAQTSLAQAQAQAPRLQGALETGGYPLAAWPVQAPFPYNSAPLVAAQTSLAQAQAQAPFPYNSAPLVAAQTSLAQAQAQAQDALNLASMESSQALADLDLAAAKVESARIMASREAAADLSLEQELQKTRLALLQATASSAKTQNNQVALLQASVAATENCGGANQMVPCRDFYRVLTFDYKYTVAMGIARWLVVLAGGFVGMGAVYYVLKFVFSVTGWVMCACQTVCCLLFLAIVAAIVITAKNSQHLVEGAM